jgi:hypothetical protein
MSNRNLTDQELYEKELMKLNTDPAHYMTPGARKYFKRVWMGYLVLAIAMIVGIWGVSHQTDKVLRSNINTFLIANCKSGIPTIKKFNAALQADIDAQKDAKELNMLRGDTQRAALNDRIIKYKKGSMLHVPTIKECENRKAF